MQKQIPKNSEAAVRRAQQDPAWWIREVLGHEPWQKQVDIFESVRDNRVTAVKSCHGAGKSFSAAAIALWYLYTHRPAIVLTTAPTDRQVKGILWKEIRMSHQRARYPLGGQLLTQELKLEPNWFAWGFTAPDYDPDRFQGFHEIYLLVVVDEASGVSEEIYEGIDGVLTSDESRLLMIGNPTNPSGRFAREFRTAGTSKISISAFDSPNFTKFGITEPDILTNTWDEKIITELPAPFLVTPRWVAEQVKRGWTTDSPLYRSKVLAQFPEQSDDTLIPLHWVEAAVGRDLAASGPTELGVDVARYGSDQSVIVKRKGPVVEILKTIQKSDLMELTGQVIQAIRSTGATMTKIDSVGIGAGVYDRLNEQDFTVLEMQAGGQSSDRDQFVNARAEWYWGLRERFDPITAAISIPDDDELISQLANIRYKINSRGQVLIESKDEMKKRGLKSPDKADAVMLVFAGRDYERGDEPTPDEALGDLADIPDLGWHGGIPGLT